MSRPRPVADAPAATAAKAASAVPAARTVEACGGTRITLPPNGLDPFALVQVDTLDTKRRSLAAMRTQGGDLAQANALALEVLTAPSNTPDPGTRAALDTLVRMAADTRDARLYGLAFRTCSVAQLRQGGSACTVLSVEQWTRLDPDNAAPWLAQAAMAQQRRDESGTLQAMQRAARAQRSDEGVGVLPAMLIDQAPKEASAALPTLALLTQVAAVQSAWVTNNHQAELAWCRPEALADPERRQACTDLAELLTAKSTTVIEHSIGTSLGQRLGWPDSRLDALRKDQQAVAAPRADAQALEPFSCDWARRELAQWRAVAQNGELAAAREAARETTAKAGTATTTR